MHPRQNGPEKPNEAATRTRDELSLDALRPQTAGRGKTPVATKRWWPRVD